MIAETPRPVRSIDVLPPVEPFLSYPAVKLLPGKRLRRTIELRSCCWSVLLHRLGVVVNATTGIIDPVASQPGTCSMGYVVQGPAMPRLGPP